jgi:transposase
MAKGYSEDLGKKVIDYILLGNSAVALARKFEISVGAVRNWYDR